MEHSIVIWALALFASIVSLVMSLVDLFLKKERKSNYVEPLAESTTSDTSDVTDENIKETVTVYDINGNVIKQYHGCCNVNGDDYSVMFDDENGKTHEIFYSMGIVITDEE